MEKILKVFESEKIYINPALKVKVIPSPLIREGNGEGYNFVELRLYPRNRTKSEPLRL